MKKIWLLFLISFFCFTEQLTSENFLKEYTLENGLEVFLVEDTSTPLVRIEFVCRAGFSSQTASTSGFFKLYSRILQAAVPQIQFSQVECKADSTNYVILVPASQTAKILETFSETAFAPCFSDEIIKGQLAEMQKEVVEAVENPSNQINAAIDSRIFSGAPWKHDSGIYPALFEKYTQENGRTVLKNISERWYTPQNSAIFISGNFDSAKMMKIVSQTFGRFYSNYRVPYEKESIPMNKNRKFVFHSTKISPDIVQIVMQYTMLDSEECELAAEIFNQDYSNLKNLLLKNSDLGIPGGDYINFGVAHKKHSSRLIMQAILQKQEMIVKKSNKKKIPNSLEQIQLLEFLLAQGIEELSSEEFISAKQQLAYDFNRLNTNSTIFMERLSDFWARKPFINYREEEFDSQNSFMLASQMEGELSKITKVQMEDLISRLQVEQPFVFVLINSADYKKNKSAYDKAGFEEINTENASWYNQKYFENVARNIEIEKNAVTVREKKSDSVNGDNDYYLKNKNELKYGKLDNGIPVVAKFNGRTSELSIMLSINGGKLKSAEEDGFEEIMIHLLCQNIQKELYRQQLQGMILGVPSIFYKCQLNSSYILIQCDKNDFNSCCKAISNALIYEDFPPSAADWAVSSVQYNRRIENGRTVNQLYDGVIKNLYAGNALEKLYDTQKEILEDVNYQDILIAYPELLDASRYSVIVTGNFDDNYFEVINRNIGFLQSFDSQIVSEKFQAEYPTENKIKIPLSHRFYADANLDRNAPMPAVLIPTADFYDPAIFVLEGPEKFTNDGVCFEAVLLYLEKLLLNKDFYVIAPDSQVNFGAIVFQWVAKQKDAEEKYRLLTEELRKNFQDGLVQETVQKIKDNWISYHMADAVTNSGTALLIQKGFEFMPDNPAGDFYLNNYNFIQTATSEDFLNILDYFQEPDLMVYSEETKEQ